MSRCTSAGMATPVACDRRITGVLARADHSRTRTRTVRWSVASSTTVWSPRSVMRLGWCPSLSSAASMPVAGRSRWPAVERGPMLVLRVLAGCDCGEEGCEPHPGDRRHRANPTAWNGHQDRLDGDLEPTSDRLDNIEHIHRGETNQDLARARSVEHSSGTSDSTAQTSPSSQDPCYPTRTLTPRSTAKRRQSWRRQRPTTQPGLATTTGPTPRTATPQRSAQRSCPVEKDPHPEWHAGRDTNVQHQPPSSRSRRSHDGP